MEKVTMYITTDSKSLCFTMNAFLTNYILYCWKKQNNIKNMRMRFKYIFFI